MRGGVDRIRVRALARAGITLAVRFTVGQLNILVEEMQGCTYGQT